VFTVSLPRVEAPAPRRPNEKPTVRSAPSPRRVLLVEDNPDARRMLRLMLELDGHDVHEAEDGISGLAQALHLRPEVAIVDIGLPGLDGCELARRLRATDAGRGMLLVAVSGYGQPEDQTLSREAGFDAHLVKPVDPDVLSRALATNFRTAA
jgi:CheY-like chemotaxis protein